YCQAPALTNQPASQSVCQGSSASFSAGASGPSLSFQWRKGTTNLSNGGNISGATTATLAINPVSATNAGNYSVVVSNSCGSVTSSIATLTVGVTTATGPASTNNCPGTAATFTTTASGLGPFSFVWKKRADMLSTEGRFTLTNSSNSSTLTINQLACTYAGSYCVAL